MINFLHDSLPKGNMFIYMVIAIMFLYTIYIIYDIYKTYKHFNKSKRVRDKYTSINKYLTVEILKSFNVPIVSVRDSNLFELLINANKLLAKIYINRTPKNIEFKLKEYKNLNEWWGKDLEVVKSSLIELVNIYNYLNILYMENGELDNKDTIESMLKIIDHCLCDLEKHIDVIVNA